MNDQTHHQSLLPILVKWCLTAVLLGLLWGVVVRLLQNSLSLIYWLYPEVLLPSMAETLEGSLHHVATHTVVGAVIVGVCAAGVWCNLRGRRMSDSAVLAVGIALIIVIGSATMTSALEGLLPPGPDIVEAP